MTREENCGSGCFAQKQPRMNEPMNTDNPQSDDFTVGPAEAPAEPAVTWR